MYHENKLRIHQITFLICCIFYVISPSHNQNIVQAKAGETNTGKLASGMVETISHTGKVISHKGDRQRLDGVIQKAFCGPNCKVATLTGIGIDERLAMPLISGCKRLAQNPVHCIIAGASIITAESGGDLKNCYHKGCMGLGNFWYDTYEAGIIDWITRYTKYWHKAKSASFFYPAKGEISRSKYCTSEISSGSDVGCPNGLKHASKTWNYLLTKF